MHRHYASAPRAGFAAGSGNATARRAGAHPAASSEAVERDCAAVRSSEVGVVSVSLAPSNEPLTSRGPRSRRVRGERQADPGAPPRTAAARAALSVARRAGRARGAVPRPVDATRNAAAREEFARFPAAFAKLSAKDQESITRARLEGLGHEEIAGRRRITEGTRVPCWRGSRARRNPAGSRLPADCARPGLRSDRIPAFASAIPWWAIQGCARAAR